MKASTFWRALRRFCARRGVPERIISDNASTFVRVREDCVRLKDLLSGQEVNKGTGLELVWEHTAPRAPWWGGFYERMVGSVKALIKKHLHRIKVSYDELETVLQEIEAVLNDRPLTYLEEDSTSQGIISPSRLMTGCPLRRLPDLCRGKARYVVPPDFPSRRARLLENHLNTFWKSWRREYVSLLQARKGQWGKENVPVIGQVVFLLDDKTPRGYWSLGKVLELLPGRDGRTRLVKVRTEGNELLRAIQSLVPLECSVDDGGICSL